MFKEIEMGYTTARVCGLVVYSFFLYATGTYMSVSLTEMSVFATAIPLAMAVGTILVDNTTRAIVTNNRRVAAIILFALVSWTLIYPALLYTVYNLFGLSVPVSAVVALVISDLIGGIVHKLTKSKMIKYLASF